MTPPTNPDDAILHANAWCGDAAATGNRSDHASAWALRSFLAPKQQFLGLESRPGLDLRDWRHKKIGWGVVLPDRDDLLDGERDTGADAPAAIRRLVAARGDAPVFRYRADIAKDGRLQRYYGHGKSASLRVSGSRGIDDKSVPRYLLIVGSPQEIPWTFQYRLQCDAFVGRLDLDDDGLERYVDALLSEWSASERDAKTPVLWAVDHGHPDITYLMRKVIAEKMQAALVGGGFDPRLLTDEDARSSELYAALAQHRPAFVLSSSHGATFPLDRTDVLKAQLGLPVDVDHALLDINTLLQTWKPSGAIWYAHACCSAGADKPSSFQGLVDGHSSLGRMLAAVAECGPCSAPLPRALLGCEHPLAAFIGHIEPTFDWTLRDPVTGQVMTDSMVVDTFYHGLHASPRMPVAMAMDLYYEAVAGLLMDHIDAIDAFNDNRDKNDAKSRAMQAKLMAVDRLSMVVLGDPTVCLPD
jgi:hypothetical protein